MGIFEPTENKKYIKFNVNKKSEIRKNIEKNESIKQIEKIHLEYLLKWWEKEKNEFDELAKRDINEIRNNLKISLYNSLHTLNVFDKFKINGLIAKWWELISYDLRTIMTVNFDGLIEGKINTIKYELDDSQKSKKSSKFDPLGYSLITKLLPQYINDLENLEIEKTEFESNLEPDVVEDVKLKSKEKIALLIDQGKYTEKEIKEIKDKIKKIRKKIKLMKNDLMNELDEKFKNMSFEDCKDFTLTLFFDDIHKNLELSLYLQREELIQKVQTLWDKYSVTLPELTHIRKKTEKEMYDNFLELGYDLK